MRYEWEIVQDGRVMAAGDCPTERIALSEANHYASQYEQDGPIDVRVFPERRLEKGDAK